MKKGEQMRELSTSMPEEEPPPPNGVEGQPEEQIIEEAEEEPQFPTFVLIENLDSISDATEDDELLDALPLFSGVFQHVHDLLRTGNFDEGNLDQEVGYGSEEWNVAETRQMFRRCFEQVCTEELADHFFGGYGKVREDIVIQSCLPTNEHGVDGYILVKKKDLPYFGLTIIQAKFREPDGEGNLKIENRETADTASTLLQKILEKQDLGNEDFKSMVEDYHELGSQGITTEPVPIRHVIFTSKPMEEQSVDFQEICNSRNISVISLSQTLSMIQKLVSPPITVGDITLEGDFVKRDKEDERVVYLGYATGKSIFEAIHAGEGKREDALLDENVRMNLKYAESKKAARAEKIRGKVEKTLEEEPTSMLSFNNGLVICHIGAVQIEDGKYTITEPRLVNGGQTASVILNSGWGDDSAAGIDGRLGSVCVPAKLVEVVNHEESRAIAEAANDQNPVTRDDLASTDDRLRSLATWLRTDLNDYNKIYLSLKAGEVQTLTESGTLDVDQYTFHKVARVIDKEDWSMAAMLAAGTGYALSMSKDPLWESSSIEVCYVDGTNIDVLGSVRKDEFDTDMFFNVSKEVFVESVLLANLVRKIFLEIGKKWSSRRRSMTDTQKLTTDENSGILKSFAGVGTGLFFQALLKEHQGDYDKYNELVKFLLGGKGFLEARGAGAEATKPSWGLMNCFGTTSRVKKWLREHDTEGYHIPLDQHSPASDKASDQHIDKLVKWCWSISQIGIDVYASDFPNDVKGAVQEVDSSGNFINSCTQKIVAQLSDSAKFPRPVPLEPQVVQPEAAAEVEYDLNSLSLKYVQLLDQPTVVMEAWIKSVIDHEVLQTDEATEFKATLDGLLDE